MNEESLFQWQPCPEGEELVGRLAAEFLTASPRTAELRDAMRGQTGTRLRDWIDYLAVPHREDLANELGHAGFAARSCAAGTLWHHPGAQFPQVVLWEQAQHALALKVESVPDFLAAHGIPAEILGEPLSRLRSARAWLEDCHELRVVERHGWPGYEPPPFDPALAVESLRFLEQFRRRPRHFRWNDAAAFASVHGRLDATIAALGVDWTTDLWFAAERDYWMSRNRAGRFQKARQDRLGLGWANHDHHTYRCRRATFHRVIAVFEKLEFQLRERFYAGEEAGWGAQVLEHPATGITIFADVDLSPEEIAGDFAHDGLEDRDGLGTVGLWCELHGESLFEAGMHHLEAQFDFDLLGEQMRDEAGIAMMKPFTNLDVLRQQFTEGERWPVSEERIQRLLDAGNISTEEAERFRQQGATGSHLENLERHAGYKGFNQSGISEIIARTDPRSLVASS